MAKTDVKAAAGQVGKTPEETLLAERARVIAGYLGEALADAYFASPARYDVGDLAMFCRDDEDPGEEVWIAGPYDAYQVEGRGEAWFPGYCVRLVNRPTRLFFAPAHSLLEHDYRVRHLRLVS